MGGSTSDFPGTTTEVLSLSPPFLRSQQCDSFNNVRDFATWQGRTVEQLKIVLYDSDGTLETRESRGYLQESGRTLSSRNHISLTTQAVRSSTNTSFPASRVILGFSGEFENTALAVQAHV